MAELSWGVSQSSSFWHFLLRGRGQREGGGDSGKGAGPEWNTSVDLERLWIWSSDGANLCGRGEKTVPTRPKLRLRQQSRRFRIKAGSQTQLPVIPALFAFGNTATLAALAAAAAGSGFPGGPGSGAADPATSGSCFHTFPPPPQRWERLPRKHLLRSNFLHICSSSELRRRSRSG